METWRQLLENWGFLGPWHTWSRWKLSSGCFISRIIRPGSSSCYLFAISRASRLPRLIVLLEIWGHGALGNTLLQQLSGTSSVRTPAYFVSCFQCMKTLKYIYIALCTGDTHRKILYMWWEAMSLNTQRPVGAAAVCVTDNGRSTGWILCMLHTVSCPDTTQYLSEFSVWTCLRSGGQITPSYALKMGNYYSFSCRPTEYLQR